MRIIEFDNHVAQELARASFVSQRRRLRSVTIALGLLAVLVLFVGIVTVGSFWAGLVLTAVALLCGVGWVYYEWLYQGRSRLRGQLQAGLKGQQHMTEILAFLDDSYYLLNNLKLPGRADDVDHVVVGPNGAFALETKNHRGRVFWRDGQWYHSKISQRGHPQPEEPIRDPTQQLKRNIDYLRSCINQTDPDLSRRARLWIEGAVVFTHPTVSVDLAPTIRESLPFPVLRARDLPSHIVSHTPRQPYSRAEVRQIVSMLGHLRRPGWHKQT